MFFEEEECFHLVSLSLNGPNLWAENENMKQFALNFGATGNVANDNIFCICILQYRFIKKINLFLQI